MGGGEGDPRPFCVVVEIATAEGGTHCDVEAIRDGDPRMVRGGDRRRETLVDRPILPVVLDGHALDRMAEREIPADVLGACLACPTRTGAGRRSMRPVADWPWTAARAARLLPRRPRRCARGLHRVWCRPRAWPD